MGLNSAQRTQKLRQSVAVKDLDGIFISQPENRFYVSGFSGSAGYLLVTPKLTVLATDFRYFEQSKLQAPEYELFQISGKVEEWFPKLVGNSPMKRLGFESENVTVALVRQIDGSAWLRPDWESSWFRSTAWLRRSALSKNRKRSSSFPGRLKSVIRP